MLTVRAGLKLAACVSLLRVQIPDYHHVHLTVRELRVWVFLLCELCTHYAFGWSVRGWDVDPAVWSPLHLPGQPLDLNSSLTVGLMGPSSHTGDDVGFWIHLQMISIFPLLADTQLMYAHVHKAWLLVWLGSAFLVCLFSSYPEKAHSHFLLSAS